MPCTNQAQSNKKGFNHVNTKQDILLVVWFLFNSKHSCILNPKYILTDCDFFFLLQIWFNNQWGEKNLEKGKYTIKMFVSKFWKFSHQLLIYKEINLQWKPMGPNVVWTHQCTLKYLLLPVRLFVPDLTLKITFVSVI